MYERFTESAQKVVQLANQEAKRLHQNFISPAHILLGLLKHNTGTAASIMRRLNIDPQTAVHDFEKTIPYIDAIARTDKLPQTPRAKKVIERAMEEARAMNHNYVGTEHLLLSLLREEDDVVAPFLTSRLGLRLDIVRQAFYNYSSPNVTLTVDSTRHSAAGQILLDLLTDASATADEVRDILAILSLSPLHGPGLTPIACTIARQQVVNTLQTIIQCNRNLSKYQ
jgi:ATP-dependent Clp protease ATP-binding subunit ClpC